MANKRCPVCDSDLHVDEDDPYADPDCPVCMQRELEYELKVENEMGDDDAEQSQ